MEVLDGLEIIAFRDAAAWESWLVDTVPPEVVAALEDNSEAKDFFDSLDTT